ncbi:unnamed protein product [Rotaria sp. Silwood1]|nr:unnamed protein product [Rotaria sp. Silwood1]
MAETFIYPGAKECLDQAYGYPPDAVVEEFQQRLKTIKAIDQYSQLMKVIEMKNIQSSDDTIDFLIESIQISNAQGYTRIRSPSEERKRRYHSSTYDDDYSRYSYKRYKY